MRDHRYYLTVMQNEQKPPETKKPTDWDRIGQNFAVAKMTFCVVGIAFLLIILVIGKIT